MTTRISLAAAAALLAAVFLGLVSCESSKGRAAAVQFAFSWEQTIKVLGFGHMSDLETVEKHSRDMTREREWLRADASESTRKEAERLDALILYVVRSLDKNIKVNAARPEADAAGGLVPVDFRDAASNKLLGLDPKNGDESAQKSIAALHGAILRFAEKVGVGGDFKDALQRREESDAKQSRPKAAAPEPTWAQVRDDKLRFARAKRTTLTAEREKVEKQAMEAKAPTGFGPAKWLMYPEEVKKVRPNATPDSDGSLVEKTEWLGRTANVRYKFDNGFLVTIIVSFEGDATEAIFAATQESLQGAYKMSTPHKMEQFILSSDYSSGLKSSQVVRFSILHVLGQLPSRLELVIYSLEYF